ncbi:glycine--tRNA ligase subunit beta [Blochmannia endosymbiont of Polyrhachis (Hedomyrma) turneri]|uniref:glycine--tRNA ligase subunit beta n=1 Tax=Blochmannia endosymbiont of Polyrhachis (Hedomyrma) turneri TaxID=1505596 RepID=UPI00061A6B53|nr:glycine--tRNA ligase subunit beta [Blochmannia endosymbiont of Polyrhachis (Hedomyrma) turneri]AKC59618.1 Glycine-tRNA ligase beta subunit [Blochmannia endosymbiont of Polyrhachis (Hedomyrma) turneri]
MVKHVLLVEIGTEMLPSKMLRRLGESFANNVKRGFKQVNIYYEQFLWFASPRRLAFQVIDISMFSEEELKNNVYSSQFVQQDITELLNTIVFDALTQLSTSTMMRWKDENRKFIRPVRSITILLDDKVVTSNFFGLPSNRVVRGHHIMANRDMILDHAAHYQKVLLESGFVIADYEYRKQIIYSGIKDFVKKVKGVIDNQIHDLLEEVTSLSEWPVILLGSFDERFLCIPYEILLYIMKVKKKYFPVYDFSGKLLPYFIFVIDIITNNSERIICAHEKLLSLCFSDVEFFLNCDKRYRLEDYLFRLNTVSFHSRLGNLYDKTMRIKFLSIWIANKIGVDVSQVERASVLSKCDLLSCMVSEFPMAQGIIGMYYARRDGELESVALAQKEQYLPGFFSDVLPSTLISCIVSIADKIDTISGMFIIGENPKGRGDPWGLRRAAFGILRIVLEKKLDINLSHLIKYSLNLYKTSLVGFNDSYVSLSIDHGLNAINSFIYKRLCILYERKGYGISIIQAVLPENIMSLVDFDKKVHALSSFCVLKKKESQQLFIIFKRIFNILKNVSGLKCGVSAVLLIEEEEIILANKLKVLSSNFQLLYNDSDYYGALVLLSALYDPVDCFFRSVVVMSENEGLRLNRLSLLNEIMCLLFQIVCHPQYIFNIYSGKK